MKRKLTLLVCVVLVMTMVFTFASCNGNKNNADHTHTFSQEWSSDATAHWHESACGHADVKANYSAHVDADNDAKCDICGRCDHNLATDWSSDATHHWNASTCNDHKDYKGNLEAHVDANNDAKCDVCKYCAHSYSNEWSSDLTGHWHEANCGCIGLDVKDFAAHVDEAGDGVCDVCQYVICAHADENGDGVCDDCQYVLCDHDPEESWTFDAENHWNKTTCEDHPDFKVNVGAHVDANENGLCDTCSYFMSTVAEVVGKIDAEAVTKINSAVIDYYKKTVSGGYEALTDIVASVKYYDNYAVYTTVDNYTFYCSYYGEAEALFVVCVDPWGEIYREENLTEYPTGTRVNLYDVAIASTYEEYVTGLYNVASKVGFVEGYNQETGMLYFSYAVVDELVYVVNVEFILDETTNGVKTANITIDGYSVADVTIDTENNTYTVAENAAKAQECVFAIAQTYGDPMDSTENPNPYSAENSIVTDDFTVVTKDEEGNVTATYGEEDTIKIIAGQDYILYFDAETAELVKLSSVTASNDGNSALNCYVMYGTQNQQIKIKSNKAGTYTCTITAEDVVLNLNIEVEYKPTTSVSAGVPDDWDNLTSTDSTNLYVGNTLVIGAIVGTGENPQVTVAVTEGNADKVTFTANGDRFNVVAQEAGTYVITLTSVSNTEISDTITVEVSPAPSVADLLNGSYEYESYDWEEGTVVFTPTSEGATTGTVVITYAKPGNYYSEAKNFTTTYTYAYDETNGVVLTYVEGDDVGFGIQISDTFEVILTYPPYGKDTGGVYLSEFTLEKQETSGGEEPEQPTGATQSPISATMTGEHTYGYNYEFTFVAGAAGNYTFTAPAGFGVISKDALENFGNPYVDFYDEGGTFTLELGAGETIDLFFGSLEAKTYELTFTYEANITTPASGSGTKADPFVITESGDYVCNYDGTGSYTYFIFYAYTATTDGNVTFTFTGSDARYYLIYGENLDLPEQLDSDLTNTITIPVTEGQTIYFGVQEYDGNPIDIPFSILLPVAQQGGGNEGETTVKDANGLGGEYSFTFVMPYTLTFEPASEGATSGILTVVDPINTQYSGDYAYTIVDGSYVFESINASITTGLDGNWYFQNPGMMQPQMFAEASTGEGGSGEGGETENNYKDANGLGGEYSFTFVMSYTLTFKPASEGATSGILTVVDPINTQYSGDYAYTIVDGSYVFESTNASITTGLDGNWYFQNPGMMQPQMFAEASTGEGGSGEGGETGTMDNPTELDTLPGSLTFVSDATNKIYYKFTATESGVLTITWPTAGDSWADLYAWANNEWDGQNSQSSFGNDTVEFDIVAGTTYRLGISAWNTTGEVTVTLSVGEGSGSGEGGEGGEQTAAPGTEENPIVIETLGDYTANAQKGYYPVYYNYTATESGYVTVTSTFATSWIGIGETIYAIESNCSDQGTISLYVTAGTTLWIGVRSYEMDQDTFEYLAADVPFTVSFRAFVSESYEKIAGTWSATVPGMDADRKYTLTVNADGTGTLSYDPFFGDTPVVETITFVLIDGTSVVIKTVDPYDYAQTYNFTYDETALTLTETQDLVPTLTKEAVSE
ncbi:MAG: hypothetical protein J6A96_05940 [Clostridia bacterium]|nr:hypothetical protein [Clostridia bacterium]